MKEEKKLNKAEEVKAEESGVKLTDEELEKVTGGGAPSQIQRSGGYVPLESEALDPKDASCSRVN